uniref:CCHC-type domain-containing protein n=1 Tax=Nothobranchius furzeri TaxID=105023 RepID=A0A1A7ZHT5_NOTFU
MSWVKKLQPSMTESSGQNSDPLAESLPPALASTLSKHENSIQSLLEHQSKTNQHLFQLESVIRQFNDKLTASIPSAPPSAAQALPVQTVQAPRLHFRVPESSPSDTYRGEYGQVRGFLLQCDLTFGTYPETYNNDQIKISYIVGLLRGRALQWAEARSRDPDFLKGTLHDFLTEFRNTFDNTETPAEISKTLWNMKQGKQTVLDFAIDFRTLATISKMDPDSLKGAFSQALNTSLQDQLAFCPEPETLEDLISLAARIEKRQRSRPRPVQPCYQPVLQNQFVQSASPPRPINVSVPQDEPMQVGRASLTPEERLHRLSSRLCLYCGKPGHFLSSCPVRPKGRARQ